MRYRICFIIAIALLSMTILVSRSKSDQGPLDFITNFISKNLTNKPFSNSQENPPWLFDYDQALLKASQENKLVMVDFSADWCGWCKRLDSETYKDLQVKERIKKFVCLKIDADKDKATCRKFGVTALPTILFLDSSGREIKRLEGFLPGTQFVQYCPK